jgi:hypothetical protein
MATGLTKPVITASICISAVAFKTPENPKSITKRQNAN